MARAPNEKINKALKLYKKGYKLIDIAKELEVAEGTVRSWKNRYKWGCDESATLQKENNKKCNVAKKEKRKETAKKKCKEESIAEEVKEVLENTDLTDKQRLFCIYYIEHFVATKAYQKAYGCSYDTAKAQGYKLLQNIAIKKEINRLTNECLEEEEINAKIINKRLFETYLKIAFSDIGDYLKFGLEEEKVWRVNADGSFKPDIDPETGEQKIRKYNFVTLNESEEVDTTIISEVSEGKDGVKVKLLDKMKALEWLDKHYGQLDILTSERLELEKARVKQAQEKIDYEKNKDNQSDKPIEILIKRKERD